MGICVRERESPAGGELGWKRYAYPIIWTITFNYRTAINMIWQELKVIDLIWEVGYTHQLLSLM